MRLFLSLALLLLAVSVRADDIADANRLLNHCAEIADEEAVGVEALEKHCPGIWRAIDTLGYAPYLSNEEYESLDKVALADLAELRDRYEGGPASAQSPDPAALGPILDELREPIQEKPQSLWEKFWAWLKGLFKSKDDKEDKESWLDRWLKNAHISERTSRIISYLFAGLVILIAVVVIANEVRVAMAARRKKADGGTAVPDLEPRSARAQLNAAALSDQPTLLLRLLVAKLVESGRLQRDRSLTHRELARRARFDVPADREIFQQIAGLSERVIYGGGRLEAAEVEPVLARGRQLYDALLRPRLSGGGEVAAS